jgi:cysteine synthase A
LSGVAWVLKKRWPDVTVIAVEPESCAVLSGGASGASRIQGLGAGFVPEVLDRRAYDRVVTVADAAAWDMKERLSREEGILAGVSSGAAALVAARIATELGASKVVATVFPDSGERYFSMAEWFGYDAGARP